MAHPLRIRARWFPTDAALAAIAGLVSAAVGLGVAELIAAMGSRLRSPVLDVGDRVVDRVPAGVKELAIDWFGTNDKVALLVGIGITLAVYAAVLGVLALRYRMVLGDAGIALFGLLGALSALGARGGAEWLNALPSILGAVTAALVLHALARFAISSPRSERGAHRIDEERPEASTPDPVDRRRFVVALAGFAVTATVLTAAGRRLASRFGASESREAVRLPPADRPLAEVGAGTQADGAAPFFTPNADFYRIDTALSVPQVPAETWQLDVTGMVDRELRLSYDDLLGRELVESDITLACVSNTVGGDLVGTARWLGVRLDDLLAEAGIDPAADQVVGRSTDGYTCGFPVAALDGRDALVAVAMNGEPLPLDHGFPARLIVPGIYGYASATKWLTEIELTTFADFDHYWVPRGYAVEAPIKLQSRIDTPRGLDRIPPGPTVIAGVAWAQTIGVDAVELRIDDGEWRSTDLATEVNDTTWRQWSLPWEATPGRHTVEVRATDRTGAIQTDRRSEPLPDGATGHHTIVVLVDEP